MLPNVATPLEVVAVKPAVTALDGVKSSLSVTVSPDVLTAFPQGSSAVTVTVAMVLSNSVSVGCPVNTRWFVPTVVVTVLSGTKSLPEPLKSLDGLIWVGHATLHPAVVGVTERDTEIVLVGATPLPVGPVLVR